MDNKELINNVLSIMIENVLNNSNTYYLYNNNYQGELISEGEYITAILKNEKVVIYEVPYDYNNKNIDLRIRKKIAIEFVNKFNLKNIYKMIEKKQKEKELKLQYQKNTALSLLTLLQDKLTSFIDPKMIKSNKINYCYGIEEYELVIDLLYNGYNSLSISIRKEYNNNLYNCYINDRKSYTLENLLSHIKKEYNNDWYIEFKKYYEKLEAKRIEKEKEAVLINNILDIYNSISEDNILLLKKGKQFICFNTWARYSVGKGKSGKYYHAYFSTLKQYIIDKGYNTYCFIKENTEVFNNEILLSLDYKSIEL